LLKSDIVCLRYEKIHRGLLFSGHSVYTHSFGFVESQPDAKKMATSNDRKLMLFFVKIACFALIIVVHLYFLILWHWCSWLCAISRDL